MEENRKKLEDSEEELKEGRAEYEKGKREGREELAEGWEGGRVAGSSRLITSQETCWSLVV